MLHAAGRQKESDGCINEFLTAEPLDGDGKARGVLEAFTVRLKDIMDNIRASDEDYSEYAAPGLTEMGDILIGDETKEQTIPTKSETRTNRAGPAVKGKRGRVSIL